MNIRSLKLVCPLGALLAFASAAHAQSHTANIHVPFEFVAGGKMLPAGDYQISEANLSPVLLIQGKAGNSVSVITTNRSAGTRIDNAKLTFERRGSEVFLSGIDMPYQSVHLPVPKAGNATLSLAADSQR